MARAGESVELASRDVTIHGLDLVDWDGTDVDRPDRDPRGGVLGRDIHPGTGARSRGGGRQCGVSRRAQPDVQRPVPSRRGDPARRVREAAADGPDALESLLRPIDAGLESLPELVLTDGEVTAISRGQFIRAALPAAEPGAPIRVRDAAGRLVAIATVRDGRLAPDKVLVDTVPATGRRMPDLPIEVAGGVEALRPEHGPLFAVIGVFDGIHLGHRYLLRCLVDEARDRGARPAVITFDSHPDEVLVGAAPPLLLDPAERVRMLGEAGVEVIVVQHFDAALRSTEYDAFVRLITASDQARGPAHDSGRRVRPRPARHAGRGPGARRAGRLRSGRRAAVRLDGRSVRSSDIRTAIAAGKFAGRGAAARAAICVWSGPFGRMAACNSTCPWLAAGRHLPGHVGRRTDVAACRRRRKRATRASKGPAAGFAAPDRLRSKKPWCGTPSQQQPRIGRRRRRRGRRCW